MYLEKTRWITIGLAAGIVAAFGDFILDVWLGWMLPRYSFMTESMSVLGVSNSPFRWVFAGWGVLFAILCFLYARSLSLLHPGQQDIKTASMLVIVYGLGEGAGSGLFPFDHSVHGGLTLSGTIHSLVSVVGVIALLLVPFSIARYFKSCHKTGYRLSTIVPFVGVILLLMFALSRYSISKDTILVFRGLWQRAFLWMFYLYLLCATPVLVHDARITTGDGTPP